MHTIIFEKLIAMSEGPTIDFKRNMYDIGTLEGRKKFLIDLMSMANTPREVSSYIVFGIDWYPSKGCELLGLDEQIDDALLQNVAYDKISPVPEFCYYPFMYKGMQFGLIEIPVQDSGPFMLKATEYDMVNNVVYFRSGSTNRRADNAQVTAIVRYFGKDREIALKAFEPTLDWNNFYELAYRFSPERKYILCVDNIAFNNVDNVDAIAGMPLRAVFDFDNKSDTTGFLKKILPKLQHAKVVHRVIGGDYRVCPEPGVHWFFACGSENGDGVISNHKIWLKNYKQSLNLQIQELVKSLSPTPSVVVVVWKNESMTKHLRTLLEELQGGFSGLADIFLVTEHLMVFRSIAEDCDVPVFNISPSELCSGINFHFRDKRDALAAQFLPTPSGAPREVDDIDQLWLSEELEVLYGGIGLSGDDSPVVFRKGGPIAWRNLQLSHDCQRSITPYIKTQIENDLKTRQSLRVNLYHAPGAGGTTVGLRIAWELHQMFPTAILKTCNSNLTAEKILKLSTLTGSCVLLIVDGYVHGESKIDELFEILKATQTPVVMLQILRRFNRQHPGGRSFWLPTKLDDAEADRFRITYSNAAPDKIKKLTALTARNDEQRNAFYYGLTAFEEEFKGLKAFVEVRINCLSDIQKKVLVWIAISHYYGQQSIPSQAFVKALGMAPTSVVKMAEIYRADSRHALELLVQDGGEDWRTIHQSVALEILKQILSNNTDDSNSNIWKQELSRYGKEFAAICCDGHHCASDKLIELVRRVFIYRDNVELLGTENSIQKHYSQLIEDIPSRNGKIDTLRYLTELYPVEAHFHAHLGRFLSLNGSSSEAIEAIEHALSINPSDAILHHMAGMVYRQSIKILTEYEYDESKLIELAKKASGYFEESRRLSPDREHAYISEVQLFLELIDRLKRNSKKETIKDILANADSDPFVKIILEKSEDLLDQVQRLYAGEQPSLYVQTCRAKLLALYENFDVALQSWDSLLARKDTIKPPIRRQIVWTILHRKGDVWENLKRKEITRINELLEKNMEEDVSDNTSLRLWLRSIRQLENPPTLDNIIERISYWKANSRDLLEATYYLYVLHAINAMTGSIQSKIEMDRYLDECKAMVRFRRDRTRSFEWIGPGSGIKQLIHQSRLGEWKDDFWQNASVLSFTPGRISKIDGPHKGLIVLPGNIQAFFVPGKSNILVGRDENSRVKTYVGFSYDGPRAWNVIKE